MADFDRPTIASHVGNPYVLAEVFRSDVRSCLEEIDRLTSLVGQMVAGNYQGDAVRLGQIAAKDEEIARLRNLNREANDVLRSAHQIALREQDTPNSTGWASYLARVDAVLASQHREMYHEECGCVGGTLDQCPQPAICFGVHP